MNTLHVLGKFISSGTYFVVYMVLSGFQKVEREALTVKDTNAFSLYKIND